MLFGMVLVNLMQFDEIEEYALWGIIYNLQLNNDKYIQS
jgi:hypothetical protein